MQRKQSRSVEKEDKQKQKTQTRSRRNQGDGREDSHLDHGQRACWGCITRQKKVSKREKQVAGDTPARGEVKSTGEETTMSTSTSSGNRKRRRERQAKQVAKHVPAKQAGQPVTGKASPASPQSRSRQSKFRQSKSRQSKSRQSKSVGRKSGTRKFWFSAKQDAE